MTTRLHTRRLDAVVAAVRERGARTVLDLGCGDGDFLLRLLREPAIERIVAVDVSHEKLARLRCRLSDVPDVVASRVDVVCDSMTDPRADFTGFDAAVLVESIEHLEPRSLSKLEQAVFRGMRPASIVITTPNADFNHLLDMPSKSFRHTDHRFEWGREKFRSWATGVARRNGYTFRFSDLEPTHPDHGGISQLGLFGRSREAVPMQSA